MSKTASTKPRNQKFSSSSQNNRESNGASEMDDPESTTSRVAKFIEQLHASKSSPPEKELITAHLLGICKARKEARMLIGTHSQAMALFVSILRSGTSLAKVNVAATLSVMCREEDLRVKVLLGGSVPPLLSMLKSESNEARKVAAEALCAISSCGLAADHVGRKIFVTEGVVPALWEQLTLKKKLDRVVEGYVTGALRNLCGDKDGYWTATLDAGGVDIIVRLLSSDNSVAQSNAASLLARVILAFSDSIAKVLASGAINSLLKLLAPENDVSARANAADALKALSSRSPKAKTSIIDAQGIPLLIGAVIAPSKEGIKGEGAQTLPQHAAKALANICGGMSTLILYLGELAQSPRLSAPVADIIGALAYCLMVFEQSPEEKSFDATEIEKILIMLLKPRDNKLVQERILEAMASFYANVHLSSTTSQPEVKKVLTGLITLASSDAQEFLILSIIQLCCESVDIWEAIKNKEGIQLLISFLGLSSEQHQEYAVEMLRMLTDQVDDSKWAITGSGGIPPLVQLLEMGSQKARENAASVLLNLCSHSEDIRSCVESAGSVPALLWLLKNGGSEGQETAAEILMMLIREADSASIDQLMMLLLGDSPSSKAHIIKVLGHVLGVASYSDLAEDGTAANKGLRSLIQVLNSSSQRNQQYAASVLADLFRSRQDICDNLATDEVINHCIKLLTSNSNRNAKAIQSAHALGALSRPSKTVSSKKKSYIAEGDVKPLVEIAKTSSIDSAETAVASLANLLSDPQVAAKALSEDVISALTRGLGEGSLEGKKNASRALHQLLRHFPVSDVLTNNAQRRFAVLAILDAVDEMDTNWNDVLDALDVVGLLARTNQSINFSYQLWSTLAEAPSAVKVLVKCLSDGPPEVQDKAIEILSRLCGDQPVGLSDALVARSRSIIALANRIMNSSSLEVRVGGLALLICAAKEHRVQSMDALDMSGYLKPLIYTLVDMMKEQSSCSSLEIEVKTPRGFSEKNDFHGIPDPATVLGGTVALWLLSIMSSHHRKNKLTVVEAGGLEALYDKLTSFNFIQQVESQDAEGLWISALLLAILFQDSNIALSPVALKFIPLLDHLLKSEEVIDRFFAAQAIASLVSQGNREINLAVAYFGVVAGLVSLLGHVESDMPKLVALSDDFSLVKNPDQVVLELLFEMEDVRIGSTAEKTIPILVDLLRPMPDRPGAPPFVVRLLTRIADGNDANKLVMAEVGALDALSRYMSLSPQDLTEDTISELLRILFSNLELVHHEAAISCTNQLIAVLHLGSRSARLNAAKALEELFDSEEVRNSEASAQAVQPMVEMLGSASRSEQAAALAALIKLTSKNSSRASLMADAEVNPLDPLLRILSSSSSSFELKSTSAELCSVLFGNSKFREMPIAADFIDPLMTLIQSGSDKALESGVCAFEKMLDDEQLVELASAYDVVDLLVQLVSGSNYRLINASICALVKLGKDRTPRKLDMVKAGIIDNCLQLLYSVPSSVCSTIAELFRILTNSSAISKSPVIIKIVEPLFMLLLRPDFDLRGQHSALQTLLNILEKPQSLTTLQLTASQVIEPLVTYLESPSQVIQQLGTELLSHLLEQEHFMQDITTKGAVEPLVHLAGIGILNLQQAAVKALKSISLSWPKSIADAGGIFELAKIIVQDEPEPSDTLLESAALLLSNVLRSNADYYFEVPVVVLVKMLYSSRESTVALALSALAVQERTDAAVAELMVQAGAVDALLDLLRSHQCDEASARLLETLFNNAQIREMKVSKYAIAPLAQYLLDPQTLSQSGKLIAALALGNLSQHEGLARISDSASACRALITLLKDQPTKDMAMVSICALQTFVMRSRTNRRAVAEAGGILVIQELILSSNADISAQAALLIKFLFSNHTLQEYVSNELIRSLTAALEREIGSNATINEEVLKTIHVMFANFPKLHISEAATLCIPPLVAALQSDNEVGKDCALNTLCLLKQSWPSIPIDVSRSQAMVAAEAIPFLQKLIETCPPSFHDRAENLLQSLPGCLTVTIERANNLKQVMGGTNAFCRLTIGNGPARQTKVVNHSTSPEWKESFTWAFDVPPKGQKLYIICKSKSTFGKTTLGKLTIQIDKVVSQGTHIGQFNLRHDSNKDSSSRTIELGITWANRLSDKSV
ncbi:OLC1v1016328C1 [Oldenlandia corymbosa var. corymbosa]|uniref:OLC1v1016328C1 n=1 Tax=Oldenlandia corymbosa var. corymbosa TaxID=529605 RepID=A0AAV1E7D5_OLDCO|nr:OLC1v1016328C1 [Oldenlandia corymbosa var. corymbosa]